MTRADTIVTPAPVAIRDPWIVDERGFPRAASIPEVLMWLLRFAILAPSTHNTQPWRFRVRDDGVELWADRGRALARIDPDGRQLVMSCGAALFNLRIAMRRFGLADRVAYFPDRRQPDLLARLQPGGEVQPDHRDLALFAAIPRRHTNREPFLEAPVSQEIADELTRESAIEGAWLERLHPDHKLEVAAVVASADRQQLADPSFRREMARWLVHRGSRRKDGIPMVKKDVATAVPLASTLLIRTFDRGSGVAAREQDLAVRSPVLAVLGTDHDEAPDWLAAGEAMQATLLRATHVGLSASFLNQAIEEQALRPRIAAAAGRPGFPQLVLRFGYGPMITPTPRRPVEDVIDRGDPPPTADAAGTGVTTRRALTEQDPHD